VAFSFLFVLEGASLLPPLTQPTEAAAGPAVSVVAQETPHIGELLEHFSPTIIRVAPGAAEAIERLKARLEMQGRDLVVLRYTSPRLTNPIGLMYPDPYLNPEAEARWAYYQAGQPPNSYCAPMAIFNGYREPYDPTTGRPCLAVGTEPETPNPALADAQIDAIYSRGRRTSTPLQIAVTGAIIQVNDIGKADDPSFRVDLSARVSVTTRLARNSLPKVRFALYENELPGMACANSPCSGLVPYVLNYLVRKMAEAPLTMKDAGQSETLTQSIELDPTWNREHLGVVVFVQDDRSRAVLEAVNLRLEPPTE
jgi:hypothetical protein